MRCTTPINVKHPKQKGTYFTVSCGQCLPCRIRKRNGWVLRNLLESRHAITSSFWTLTFEDKALHQAKQWRNTARTFFKALSMSERRAGNSIPIRYYGCFQLGGRYGRPHYHFLIYNMLKNFRNSQPYLRGLPRATLNISQWPHGHVDIAEFNPKTVSYVADYSTDFFTDSKLGNTRISTRRPAIGFSGIQHLAQQHAKKCSTLLWTPDYFQHNGRMYPLDKWTKDTFTDQFEKAGGKYIPPKGEEKIERKTTLDLAYAALPEYIIERDRRKLQEKKETFVRAKQRKEQFEQRASARYLQKTAQTLSHPDPDREPSSPRFL